MLALEFFATPDGPLFNEMAPRVHNSGHWTIEAPLDEALAALGVPAVLKTRRFGYDGKGQARIMRPSEAGEAWQAVRGAPSILESFIDFEAEFSILLCRGGDGGIVTWPAPCNVHEGGVLRRSQVPTEGLDAQVAEADALARQAAEALDYVGVLALEFFATPEGPLFNEMAPRVHNSGHWTIEGSVTSQFENHVRAICGLPLGATGLTGTRVEMENLIGGRGGGVVGDPRGPHRPPPPLRQGRGTTGPQDGPCDQGDPLSRRPSEGWGPRG